TDRRNPAVVIAPGLILVAGGFGLMATLVAALVPAWTAAHVPVLAALSGRRPAQAPARRTLRLGLVLIGLAIAMTATGATLRLHDTDGSSGTVSIVLLFAGAILGTLGFGACSPWLLERLEPPAARLPPAGPILGAGTADRLVWIGPAGDADVNDGLGNVTVGDAELLKALGAEEATL